jgi:ABC-type sulfate transport system permease component
MKYAIDTTFAAAAIAILLATVAGVLTALFPSDAYPWIVPVVVGITGFAGLIRKQFHVPDDEA